MEGRGGGQSGAAAAAAAAAADEMEEDNDDDDEEVAIEPLFCPFRSVPTAIWSLGTPRAMATPQIAMLIRRFVKEMRVVPAAAAAARFDADGWPLNPRGRTGLHLRGVLRR